jgi:rod shape-determining protein MreC
MELERRVVYAESKYKDLIADSLYHIPSNDEVFTTIGARVINNTLHKLDNFITLNRGRSSGIEPDMGVLDAQGVVGIVYKVSDHYSLVISLLNSQMNLSCKIKGTDYFGYLHWEGDDPQAAYLKDLPRHAEFTLGDTIITSGFSTVFPGGLMVGTVDDITDSNDGLSYLLKVKLASNFGALRDVTVIAATEKEERDYLENNTEDRREP